MRYKLPEALGGGELDEYRHVDGGTEAPVGTVAFLVEGCIVAVARGLLTEVKPPLPEEPPFGAVVLDSDEQAWQRFMPTPPGDRSGVEWSCAGEGADECWAGLQTYGPLTRLVPDPFAEPVELPWKREFDTSTLIVERSNASNRAVYVDGMYGHITADEARAMARALMAAADAAEKE